MEENTRQHDQIQAEPSVPAQRDLFLQDEDLAGPAEQQQNTASAENTAPQTAGTQLFIQPGSSGEQNSQEPVKQPKSRVLKSLQCAPGTSLGEMLIQARHLAGKSLDQVIDETRIRRDYLEALEKDSWENLSIGRVFIQSYIRTLAEIYQLDKPSRERLFEQFENKKKNTAEDIPEKILEHIGKEGKISEEEAQRVRLICIYGGIIVFLLISLAVTSIVAISYRNSKQESSASQTSYSGQTLKPFNREKIETLLAPQVPDPVVLEIPRQQKR